MNNVKGIDQFDVIIIGGGPMGLSSAYYINKLDASKKILVLEQFSFINENSSSAGKSRQFRIQYETVPMAEMALIAEQQWLYFNKLSGKKLLDQVGSLWFGEPGISSSEGSVDQAICVMDELGIQYHNLPTGEDIMNNSHFNNIPCDYYGFFQADGGILNIDATQQFLLSELQKQENITLQDFTKVSSIESLETGQIKVTVAEQNTDKVIGYYSSNQLAITVGPYVNDVVSNFDLKVDIDIWEMSSAYYKIDDAETAEIGTTWYVFQEPALTNVFYGFNEVDWANPGYVRVAPAIPDCYLESPSDHTNIASPESIRLTDQWVNDHMPGLTPHAEHTSTCMIAISKTERELMLDYLPDFINNNKNIVVYTAGWGGKFIPTIGDLISKMLAGSLTPAESSFLNENTRIDWSLV